MAGIPSYPEFSSRSGPKLTMSARRNEIKSHHPDSYENRSFGSIGKLVSSLGLSCFRRSRLEPSPASVTGTTKRASEETAFERATTSAMELPSHGSKINAHPYQWPYNSAVDPSNTALVIIDMQNDFCSAEGYIGHQGIDIQPVLKIIPRIQSLLEACRAAHFPIYHTREGHRPDLSTLSRRELLRSRNNPSGIGMGDPGPLGRLLVRGEPGHDIIKELYPLPGEPIIDKPGRSAFQHTDFKLLLDNRGIRNLILCGVTTDVCVTSTMRDGNDRGLDCLLVSDATAAGEQDLHEAAVAMVCTEGGIFGAVATTGDVLAVIRGDRADTAGL